MPRIPAEINAPLASKEQAASATQGLSPALSPRATGMAEVANEAAELKLHSCIGFTGESRRLRDSQMQRRVASFLFGRPCLFLVGTPPQRESCGPLPAQRLPERNGCR